MKSLPLFCVLAFLVQLLPTLALLHALVAALVMAGLHGWWGGVLWFVGVFWAFVVDSYAFILWRPVSFRHAFAAAAIPHALMNQAAGVAGRLWP